MNPEKNRAAAVEIVRALRARGRVALLAGGCVRDALLGLSPKDHDVATDARPEEVLALFPRAVAVGAEFGVVRVPTGDETVEVATFRRDDRYEDGRHPVAVTFSGPEDDARRRDFTINGMFLDPSTGAVIDHVGGRADLEKGIVRAIGDPRERFGEDRLRLLRAVRFAARFSFAIESGTLAAIRELAPLATGLSPERIREEIEKMLLGPRPSVAFRLLAETGLLAAVLPEVDATRGVEQPPEYHPEGDVFTHVLLMLEKLPPDATFELAMGVLLHDVGKPPTFEKTDRIRFHNHADVGAEMAEAVCERLRCSRRSRERIVALVRDHMKFAEVTRMRESRLRRFLASDGIEEHLELHRIDCESSHRKLDHYEFCRGKLEAYAAESPLPKPFVTGDDLIALGHAPGPEIGRLLRALFDRQLEGEFATRDEALAEARRLSG